MKVEISQSTNKVNTTLPELPQSARIPQIKVQRKRDGMIMKINECDFGAGKEFEPVHFREMTVQELDEDFFTTDVGLEVIKASSYTKEEMLKISVLELANLPECKHFNVRECKNKETMVDMILEKRKQLTAINEDTVVDAQTSQRRPRRKKE